MPIVVLLALASTLFIAFAVAKHRGQQRVLRRLRATWAEPLDRKRRMDSIREWDRSRRESSGASPALDDRTWDDLNLDSVFAHLDRTESTLGQCALYSRLRSTPLALNLSAFDAVTTRMNDDASVRERAQTALSRLQDVNGYNLWALVDAGALTAPRWYAVFPFLTLAVLLSAGLFALKGAAFLPFMLFALAINVIVGLTAASRILRVATIFRQIAPVIATAQHLTFLNGADLVAVSGPIHAAVPRLGMLKSISRIVSSNPLMVSVDSPLMLTFFNDLLFVAYEYLNLALLLDWNAILFGAPMLKARAAQLLQLIVAMGELDAAIGVASFRAGSGKWTRPRFCEPGEPVVLTDVEHPLVHDAVANSIQLAPPHGVIVTGSNMSGKSTFLRTVGVASVMAQTINTCSAASYVAPMLKVRSCIGRSDDLLAGKSYYAVEVETLLSLVASSEHRAPHLFLLDELFRGTNAVERIAAGEAVLNHLILKDGTFKDHLVLAATHDGELVDFLRGSYVPYHFSDTVSGDGLSFDYRLTPGAATSRNAITLLKLHGAPESIVSGALSRVAALASKQRIDV